MTKRREILKKLRDGAKAADVEPEEREGGRHTLIILDGLRIPVGRHSEIPDRDAEKIYKEAEPKLGKDWWK
ncbi:Conserved protein of uncharacterised function, possible phage protein, Gp92 [Mycobacteroides abscessus subsp. bolletii]|uniref:hypothetical protein n=1 Tax=Mycobacteroides abscessus TaxID=36809 RepID=UPI00092A12C3|nr:hypothetical protein [Mycobacteroides abscessus]SIJ39159.1 Conserved protein of uncharacterised function, possible phage protein, Gp92 [Mycobacteroides abscessus subsp. bolletii]SLE27399.1 Conserved protein of uncharacterised function, possible phage protein, Gp92 [Mycobacteroides abscessus subsp. bolletii]SLF14683.1 Conserved protein of uncharacterised function, possible phage protein, Gp92 [Mycobacteroides abscessus subsp. bolletii]